MGFLDAIFGTYSQKELKRINPIMEKVCALEEKYAAFSDKELCDMTPKLKERLQNGESTDDILPDAFAVCREAAWRVLGMKHYPVQIIGGIVLHQGRISEMKTGEGKTLVATLPAYLNALTGLGVHIVTVNDYLAERDSQWMGKVFRFLGLSVGLIVHDLDNDKRREAYCADITYGTNNELGFDYLRDNMVIYKEQKVQRPFNYAIVDEVDSILIDEARTPLIISGQGDKSTELYQIADMFAKRLKRTLVKELSDNESHEQIEGDYIVDEKAKTATLTASGIAKAEEFFKVENLMDADNLTLLHHINQAIRANGVMKNEVDYVVKDGEVIIVDEFTGRLMLGRRYNEGLHQAIEAKEGVQVEHEAKTLASITFQNYFRLYKKLAGMTGTALTEESEFREIYNLDVVEIPTNKPLARIDHPDVVYKTELSKFNAVINQIIECHEKGQPVLVGTISIEKSEILSKMLRKKGIKHEVLNAKYHEKEAEIVAQAGKLGAVTIATNMAGRGTDIVLGGNAEYLAKAEMRRMGIPEELIAEATGFNETEDENILSARQTFRELEKKYKESIRFEADKVKEAGGLFILGTERHESRRIDNQLRGRAGRQGDSGATRFYLSLEDDLMRLFGGSRVDAIMDAFKMDPSLPIENKMLTNVIESAQRKVEGRNFAMRKSVLNFDDVMNRQREIIYGQRGTVLDGENVHDSIVNMIRGSIVDTVNEYISEGVPHDDWNLTGLRDYYRGFLTKDGDFEYDAKQLGDISKDEIIDMLYERAMSLYEERENLYGSELMRELERVILLRMVDTKWMDHIDDMEELQKGIYLRSYGQHDPVVEYRKEGFEMFDQMISSIREDTARLVLTFEIKAERPLERKQVANPTAASHGSDGTVKKRPVRKVQKIGRNDPCPCGSGKKYKNCCLLKQNDS